MLSDDFVVNKKTHLPGEPSLVLSDPVKITSFVSAFALLKKELQVKQV